MLVRVMPNYTRRQSYLYTIVSTPCTNLQYKQIRTRTRFQTRANTHPIILAPQSRARGSISYDGGRFHTSCSHLQQLLQ